MSIQSNNSLDNAISILRGESPSIHNQDAFSLQELSVWRLSGITPAPGHAQLDLNSAWESVVRSWSGLNMTWGICIEGNSDSLSWNIIVPSSNPSAIETIKTHLSGANINHTGELRSLAGKLDNLEYHSSMAGHHTTDPTAGLESTVRSVKGKKFMILILAGAVPSRDVHLKIQHLKDEEQFTRDEYISRPGLEHDSYAPASEYLALIEAAHSRASTAIQEGGWNMRTLIAASNPVALRQLQSLIHGANASELGSPEPLRWQDTSDPRKVTFLNTREAAALTRLPQQEIAGFAMEADLIGEAGSKSTSFAISTPEIAAEDSSITYGRILDDSGNPGQWLDLPINDLTRHLLVAGMPGSGKSITCEHLLLELWREHQIPWLVIEPGMKTGYRKLLNSEINEDLYVWAIGSPDSPRFNMNPMAAPLGIGLAEHTSSLYSVLASAFDLVAPMPEVLATAIESTYRKHGWDLSQPVPEGDPPNLQDLINELDESIKQLGYGPELTGNLRAGLLLRLNRLLRGPLAPELSSHKGMDITSLVTKPTIIELSALPDAESQALVMGLISLQLKHHWRLQGESSSLRHIFLIEEAHRLLKNNSNNNVQTSSQQAVEDLSNMLAELRGFGVGMIIVDQSPSSLAPSVIANTGTKILHRLDHPSDREIAGRSAGISTNDIDLLGSLSVGQAILRSERRIRPFRIKMPNPSVTYGHLPTPSLPITCSVCHAKNCKAMNEGKNKPHLKKRLQQLQSELKQSENSVWIWSKQEIRTHLPDSSNSHHPLCFMVALGESSGVSAKTIDRLMTTFKSKN